MHSLPIAVVDLGSNSGRIVVVRASGVGLEVLADAGSPLKLVRDLDATGRLGPAAIARTVDVLRGFQGVAVAAGASRTIVVATAAVREATDGKDLLERVASETGLVPRLLDGQAEALYGFLGAVHGLPVDHGWTLDVGGGSAQLGHFQDRGLKSSWTMRLGSLRLSDRFLKSDPPTRVEMDRLRDHVRETLSTAGATGSFEGETLVGTGGTIRNLAKADRRSLAQDYPIGRLHGYIVHRERLRALLERLAGMPMAQRGGLPGLNEDRADSIVGGALVVDTVMEIAGLDRLMVSGQGLREGLALEATAGPRLPAFDAVRRDSRRAFARRFTTWDERCAQRRASIADDLLCAVERGVAGDLRSAVADAAHLLDIGRSVDYYNRHGHAAALASQADLVGMAHRDVALVAAILRGADTRETSLKAFRPLLVASDESAVARAGSILNLADELERQQDGEGALAIHYDGERQHVAVVGSVHSSRPLQAAALRFRHVLGCPVTIGSAGE